MYKGGIQPNGYEKCWR